MSGTTKPKTYAQRVLEVTKEIEVAAEMIRSLEKTRDDWTRPEGITIQIGYPFPVVRKDGTVQPLLAGVQREALRTIDDRLHHYRGQLEGLRFRLVNLGREG